MPHDVLDESDEVKKLDRNFDILKFELMRNAFYHSDEVWFYSLTDRVTKFLSVLAGTAVIGSAFQNCPIVGILSGFAIAVLQTYGLVFEISAKALLHESKRQRYFALLADLESGPRTQENIARIQSEMTRTWGDEPPIYWGVEAVAWNTAFTAMKKNIGRGDLVQITRWEKMIRFFWRFNSEHFRKRDNAI